MPGVVNPPEKMKYQYWTTPKPAMPLEEWMVRAKEHAGSWWPHWAERLADIRRLDAPRDRRDTRCDRDRAGQLREGACVVGGKAITAQYGRARPNLAETQRQSDDGGGCGPPNWCNAKTSFFGLDQAQWRAPRDLLKWQCN